MKQHYKSLFLAFVALILFVSPKAQTIQIGTGIQTSGNTTASPVNGYFNFMRYQTVYTAAEFSAQGVTATSNITTIAYFVTAIPAGGLPNYQIRMANTTATDASVHVADPLTSVYLNAAGPALVPNAWNTITLSTPFVWDGVSNLLVDVTFGSAPFTTPYGSLYTFTSTAGSRYVRCDACGSQAATATTTVQNTKPQTQFTFVALGGCTGAPTAGTATGPALTCNGADFNLILTGNTNAGDITIQWQSSADGTTYADINGAITASALVSQTAETYYRAIVTCTNSAQSDTSNVILVGMSSVLDCYCPSEATNTADTKIDSVQFLTVSTGSAPTVCETYTNYSAQVGTAQIGVPFNLHIVNGSCSGSFYDAYVAVYIDYNQDGVLDSINELAASFGPTTGRNTIPDTLILIPNGALLGQTRMRIILAEDIDITLPCASYSYGETEDYTLNITAAPPCSDPVTAGSIAAPADVCPGTTVNLVLSGHTVGTQLQWESSPDGTTWSEIAGAINSIYTATITDTVFYRVEVKCADSVYTAPVEIDLTPFMSCYCTTGLGGGDCIAGNAEITNVSIDNTTLNNTSSCASVGGDTYTSYPDTGSATATLLQNVTYTFNVNTNDDAIISVWIDYDQDGRYDVSEWTQITLNSQNGSANVLIDPNALLGQTSMRIRSRAFGNLNGAGDACTNFLSGETEDYIITIGPEPACVNPAVGGVASGPLTGTGGVVYLYQLTGSSGDIQWQYSTDSATGAFTTIANADDDTLSVLFASGTYWVRAYVTSPGCDPDSSNVLQVIITYPADDVCNARSLSFGTNGPYITTYASAQAGEPAPPAGGCETAGQWCNATLSNTLWFTFVAPASGRVRIQSPDFDTQLALWDADNCDTILNGGATLIAANDDDPGVHGGVNFSSFIDSAVCLTPGRTYYVQLDPYDAPGDTTTIILTDLGGITVALNTQTDVSCFGLSDGAINVNVTGGSGSYTYLWSDNATTQDISGLAAGTYTLTVNEAGCRAAVISAPFTINEPAPIVPALDSLVNVRCFGDSTGGIYVTVSGGNPPYTYAWSNGTANEDLVGVPMGIYSATLTDSEGCIFTSPNIPISQPTALVVTLDSVTNSGCPGVSTGAVYITVSGGTPGYAYDWSNGGNTQDISSLAGGLYSVTVADTLGCTAGVSATVTSGVGLTITIDLVTNSACAGLSTGAIDISVSGGTPGYTYIWSNSDNTQDISGLAGGLYTVTATDAVGCSASESTTVNNGAGPVIIVDLVTASACAGLSTGAIDISVSGGTPGYTYIWSNSDNTQDISGLAAGAYTVSVADVSGCTATETATVNNGGGVVITVDLITDNACAGLATGAVDISISGGTPGYAYDWNNGDGTQDITGLAAGLFEVTVSDVSGCTASATAMVDNGAGVVIAIDAITSNACAGQSTGAIDISVSGGTPAYTYDWNTGDTTQDISDLAAGVFGVTVEDAVGCTASGSATVNDGATIVATVDSSGDVSCHSVSDGFVAISVSGGSAPYSYDWSNADTTQDISGLPGGNYSVDVNDANGCTASLGPVTVVEPAILTITLDSVRAVSCFGGNTGAAYTTVAGGTSPTSIMWDNSAVTQDIANLTAGTYVATLLDAHGCTATVSATISEPAAALTATSTNTNQIQGGTLGSIDVTVSGGTSPYTSLWSNNATSQDLNNLTAGVYTATITDANGCTTVLRDTVILIVGIENIANVFAVNLYPNPSQDKVFLELILNEASNVALEIFNVEGQLIQQYAETNIVATKFEMNFANEAAGVYYAKIKMGENTLVRRIVVTR